MKQKLFHRKGVTLRKITSFLKFQDKGKNCLCHLTPFLQCHTAQSEGKVSDFTNNPEGWVTTLGSGKLPSYFYYWTLSESGREVRLAGQAGCEWFTWRKGTDVVCYKSKISERDSIIRSLTSLSPDNCPFSKDPLAHITTVETTTATISTVHPVNARS